MSQQPASRDVKPAEGRGASRAKVSRSHFATRCVHAGQSPEPVTGAITTPLFQTSTYVQQGLGRHTGYEYARLQNPTREATEANIADLEAGNHGIAFASGMAAIECLVKAVAAGGHIVSEENTYGGTTRMFTQVLDRLGIGVTLVDCRNVAAVREAMRPETGLIHLETPSNPLMRITDIGAVARVARDHDAVLCVDNTFASPYNQQPLAMGADVVVHSTTKYLNGHSDVLGGILVLDDDALADEIRFVRKSTGPIPGPMDSWLTLRGTRTLHVRMERHNENGMRIAEFLEAHPMVRTVHYPGLASHPQHQLAATQMTGFSGMLSAEVEESDAKRLAEGTRIFRLAESLGGVESMICVPSVMTHASVPEDARLRMGITGGLVRLSAGIEDWRDLVEDLDRGLRR
ncbi:MAG: PLP-dependent aspartate aminotransferase family protein [Gemmatimonadetes bacterium]|nr:PLP-dependent aspartate aminotransferase family protein [Gemmatimonadota bacterium]